MKSDEKIASNILADRLALLESADIVSKHVSEENKSKFIYKLSEKGISLLPLLIEMYVWGSEHFPKKKPDDLLKKIAKDKNKVIKEYTQKLRAEV